MVIEFKINELDSFLTDIACQLGVEMKNGGFLIPSEQGNGHFKQIVFDKHFLLTYYELLLNDQIQLSTGAYLKIEFIKRNNKTVSMILLYMRLIWMKANGYAERKAPSFIVYDERFHSNYQEYGCRKGEYLGTPIATVYIPV